MDLCNPKFHNHTSDMTTSTPKRRAPQGMESDKPVAVRLSPEEKAELAELSRQEGRFKSSMMRIIYLRGLEVFKAERSTGTR